MATAASLRLRAAVDALRMGGLIAYPTEAVWGLGCEPLNRHAVERLLRVKQRDWRKGLIVVADDFERLAPFTAPVPQAQLERAMATWPGPATWLFPADPAVPWWVRGTHDRIAVRVSAHPLVAALCRAYGGAIISTSANVAGHPPAKTALQVRARFGTQVDYVLTGALGGLSRPTAIRDLATGEVLRA